MRAAQVGSHLMIMSTVAVLIPSQLFSSFFPELYMSSLCINNVIAIFAASLGVSTDAEIVIARQAILKISRAVRAFLPDSMC